MPFIRLISGNKIGCHRDRGQCEGTEKPARVKIHPPIIFIGPTMGGSQTRVVCDVGFVRAVEETCPLSEVMYAINLIGIGRKRAGRVYLQPWSVNKLAKERRISMYARARNFLAQISPLDHASIYLRCVQIKYRWRSSVFASLERMFFTMTNAGEEASLILRSLAESRKRPITLGEFHARTTNSALRYRSLYEKRRAALVRPPRQPCLRQAFELGSIRVVRVSQMKYRLPAPLSLVDGTAGIGGSLAQTIETGNLVLQPALDASRGS